MNYKSSYTLLGLPLVHVATGQVVDGRYQSGTARGWIAIGDISFGVLFAAGGLACGAVSIGGLGIGLTCLAGVAVGGYALGGLAVGIIALGGGAIAWHAAFGGLAIAGEFAWGGLAIAEHANDAAARQFMDANMMIKYGRALLDLSPLFALLVLLPVIALLRRRKG